MPGTQGSALCAWWAPPLAPIARRTVPRQRCAFGPIWDILARGESRLPLETRHAPPLPGPRPIARGARGRSPLAHVARGEGGSDARAVADPLRGRRAPPSPGRLHRRNQPGSGEEGARPRPRPDLPRARQPRRRTPRRRPCAQPAAEAPVRGDPARDPRALPRGVPGGSHGARGDDVPLGPRLRCHLRPRPHRARGSGDRARGAQRGLPPGARPRPRRLARRPLGPHRGDVRRGSLPLGRPRHAVRPRPAGREAGPARHPQALRRPLLERGGAQPRPGAPRLARA